MEFVLAQGKQPDEQCSTLILPALSIGNVGQLSVDLLVASLKAERAGYLDDPYVLPCVGNDAYGPFPQGVLALPLEAYNSSPNGLTLVQQRSPVVKGKTVEYAKHVADFTAASGKKHVIVLSSLDFGLWQNIDLSSGLQVFYLSSANEDGSNPECEKLGWKRLQDYNPSQRGWQYLRALAEATDAQEISSPFEDNEEEDEDYYPSLPYAALFSCLKAKGLTVTCLLCYCSEGDNIPEALHLAEAARRYARINSKEGADTAQWVIPCSWNTFYGPPPDMSLF
uniref:Proteasome assembly chaperone 2 n=1 Tax=Kalanchoe fedtschenkoi TaxID=63787 RepID=A0A7N0TDE5_KALFE